MHLYDQKESIWILSGFQIIHKESTWNLEPRWNPCGMVEGGKVLKEGDSLKASDKEPIPGIGREGRCIGLSSHPRDSTGPTGWQDALVRGLNQRPPNINTRLLARGGICNCQFLVDNVKGSALETMESTIICQHLNDALKKAMPGDNHTIKSTQQMPNGGLLLEIASDAGSNSLKQEENGQKFHDHIKEVLKANYIPKKDQVKASISTANEAILYSLTIFNM
ncbi:hypothetical protein BDQ12DRAFT_670755 [Crucibulum laeve]|uniref:Uncharacterized protein n=1 Tax=Crucibulum laeve TaxID=68775 RepID=A0A5C3LJE4_9AGAR|nr:hypothetical protein BDQ12DRAFT_670755 [Crucibulum laeve]